MKIRQGILWGLIIALVYGWHVIWWVFLPPELPERTVRARPTSLRYIPVKAGVDDDAEDLWTPTLFAYPFKAGFSKPLLKSDAGSVPPLRLVRDLSVYYPRPVQTNAPAIPVRTPALLPEVEARLADFDFSPEVLEQHPDAIAPLVTSIRTSPPALLLKPHPIPDDLAALTNETWQANFRLQFLENGFVERAYIELSLDHAPLRTSLLAWAYGHCLSLPQPGAIASITVSHIVPYQEPEPESEEADPTIREVN